MKIDFGGAADSEPFSIDDYARYEDGFLTAYEVTQLELTNTHLVVLSACETGLGEIQNGEGVWGLQRAFQLAGAQSIMGSLWKISDEATVTFMETFYKTYFAQNDIQAAYREAMQVTRKAYAHPYFWGAFTLRGMN
ncbi:MAG: CHAT domain-containing protein [Flammeovirgaceae bacterium]|nr:CHAT domain-containing protein [Flammeovirgaceae bacterium]